MNDGTDYDNRDWPAGQPQTRIFRRANRLMAGVVVATGLLFVAQAEGWIGVAIVLGATGPVGNDLHPVVGDVRVGFDWQAVEGEAAAKQKNKPDKKNQRFFAER